MFSTKVSFGYRYAFLEKQTFRLKYQATSLIDQQGAALDKMLNKMEKKIKKLTNPLTVGVTRKVPNTSLFEGEDKMLLKRRQQFLNKKFFEQITLLLSSGSFAEHLKSFDFVVNQVSIC